MADLFITVVIPCYNSANYILDTLSSVLQQDYRDFEVIIVDDGSTDDTAKVIEPFRSRIRYIHQKNSGGPAKPRNVGIQLAQGDLISFFDSDDVMIAGKLKTAAEVFSKQPEIDLLFTNFCSIDVTGNVLKSDYLGSYQEFRRALLPADEPLTGLLRGRELYHELLKANFIGTSSVVVRRAALMEVGGFDESLYNSDDRDMWFKLAWANKTFAFCNKNYHMYRYRTDSVSKQRVHRRFPSVINVLQKQLDHRLTKSERSLIEGRIRAIKIGYAWGLRRAGEYDAALAIYHSVLTESWSWLAARGVLFTLLQRFLPR
jgi:glycosyltransferase involved in cell wall biosynthesis